MRLVAAFILSGALLTPALAIEGKADQYSNARIEGHVVEPRKLEVTEGRAKDMLKLPQGFSVSVFADNLINPRWIAVGEDGTVYASRRNIGDILMLRDENGDGKADVVKTVASRSDMHGITIHQGKAYMVTAKDVYVADVKADGTLSDLRRIINDLPEAGQHKNRTLAVGPDGMLYIQVASTCNACDESNPENATILQASLDGKTRRIFASGLRNTIGFAWHPVTGALYGMDHGIDWLGDQEHVEELNLIQEGKQYGWPYIYGEGKFNPEDEPPEGITLAQWRDWSEAPLLGYTPHAAPLQMVFYSGQQFPREYQGDALVAMRGSWNRREPSGYEVVRVRFEDGKPVRFEPFMTGFLQKDEQGYGYLGRPVGLAVMRDGSLLVGDDSNGVIYRVTYTGPKEPEATAASAQGGTAPAPATPVGKVSPPASDLAIRLVEPKVQTAALQVTSPKFQANDAIPLTYSAYGDNASPPITWSGAPEGTKSFVVIVDDPDTETAKPYTYWVAYNIPATTTSLREGLQTSPMLQDPKGLMQGRNTRGSVGYTGLKPPVGDPAHRYHIQVFALDRNLDLRAGAMRAEVIEAMKDHVLAEGELVGSFERKQP
ncbi:YbhB/YbcL family Raf kinase inhibitor-like protein [Microvirga pakistanensis]|uniref:YbhB/YbcL family Raf kinase inhibitor-like protein n=1 Tax=Microvirga pakistanensis TaxID=1682650 RepID=UPI001FCEA427|nr:YbhB/YbcL family Raf kinase inhibitor-like protein [Microvirga pakistanensis]